MTVVGWSQIAVVLVLVHRNRHTGQQLHCRVYAGKENFLSPVLRPVERGFYRFAGVDETREQSWYIYAIAMIAFSIAGFVSLYALQRLQNVLPLNPQGFDAVPADLAFNTSVSFITNTNWQNYGGETTMSHLTQMLGLTVHNFLSAATGLAMAFALVRAFARSSATTVGNFWVDMSRVVLYVLLPISIVFALVFVALGMPQTLAGSVDVTTLEGAKQTISMGPMASQEVIKELGTNGGGFMNANSAHPFENPNAWTNILEIWRLLLVPIASVLAFGRAVGDCEQGRAILIAMAVLLVVGDRRRLLGGEHGNVWRDRARRRSLGRQSRGQGGALRAGDERDVRHRDDRHQHRRGQHDARFADAARRARAVVQSARRLHLAGRRRRGAVWLPRRRRHRRLRRRPDGRAHARISRQEDRNRAR